MPPLFYLWSSESGGSADPQTNMGACRGFSLVEVVLALGIAAFALLVIVGLLPVGLQMAGESEDESRAVNILSSVTADRRVGAFGEPSKKFSFPSLTNVSREGSFFVREDGSLAADVATARYRVSYIVTPPPAGSLTPYQVLLRVGWPAAQTNSVKSFEAVASFPQP